MTFYDDPNRECVGLDPIWTGAGEPEAEPGSGELPGDVDKFTVAQIQAWVDDHPHYAADVLTHEQARKSSARTTLVDWLQGFIDSHDGPG